jgi:L-malate glycosyltransferase
MSIINTLFVLPQLQRGGSETLVFNLAKAMDRERFQPSVASLLSGGNQAFIQEFQENKVNVFCIPKKANVDFALMRQLSELVAEREIKIINAHHFISMVYSFYACKKNKQMGLIYTEHSSWEVKNIPLKWRFVGHYLLNQIDGIVGVTNEIATIIRKKFLLKKSKVTAIENGVNLNRFKSGHDKQALRKSFGFDPHEKIIGMVANFRNVKNHIFLLKAFMNLIKEHRGLKLILIGRGFDNDPEGSEKEINKFINDNCLCDDVVLMGYRTDIPELLATMDVFCLTSLNEGLPISIIEAMASGLPIVGTDVHGIRSIVKHGENGFLVSPHDETSLCEALRKLLFDSRINLMFGTASQGIANDLYSIERCVNKYQDLFLKVFSAKMGEVTPNEIISL